MTRYYCGQERREIETVLVMRHPCPCCHAPAGLPCRTRDNWIAKKPHRYRVLAALKTSAVRENQSPVEEK